MLKYHLVSILSLFTWIATAGAAGITRGHQAPPMHDDPFGRMCYELQREGICSEPCHILPPNCISGEEAARRRACAIGQLNGTLDPNCKPIVLPTPAGAPDENLAISAQVRGGTMYWNLWTTCKSCGFSLDEVILYDDNTYKSFLHSTELNHHKGVILGATGENGWAPYTSSTGLSGRIVYFNPKLCPTGQGSCHPVKNFILVNDTAHSQARIYSSFEEFAQAEGNPFTCDISAEGDANCTFNIPQGR